MLALKRLLLHLVAGGEVVKPEENHDATPVE